MKIAVVTDSTSDISPQEAEALNITVIPALLIVDGKEYEDGNGMSREEFYSQLSTYNPPPTTAAPSLGMFTQIYQNLFDQGFDRIVSVHVAASLSSMHSAAQVAARAFKDLITVVDSGQLSMGLGFQVIAAAKAALQTGNARTFENILQAIKNIENRIKVIAMLDTMEQLKRSGRVSWLQAGLGGLLQVKLFVELKNGAVLRLGETRTRKKGIKQLSGMLDQFGKFEQLSILHTNAPQEAMALAEKYPLPDKQLPSIRNVTTVIGTHVGVNALGFAAVLSQ